MNCLASAQPTAFLEPKLVLIKLKDPPHSISCPCSLGLICVRKLTCNWQRLPGTSPRLAFTPNLQLGWCFGTIFPCMLMACVIACEDFLGADEVLWAFLPGTVHFWNTYWSSSLAGALMLLLTASSVVSVWPEWLLSCSSIRVRSMGQCMGTGVFSFK